MHKLDAYQSLVEQFERHYLFRSSADMLEWDAQTTMPEGGSDLRGAQLAVLRVAAHEAIAQPSTAAQLDQAERNPPTDEWQKANLACMRRQWIHMASVPADLVEARTRAVSKSEMHWRSARKNDDFASLLPLLQEVLTLTRRTGEAKAAALGTSVYDALIDEFEPGVREESLAPLFENLERELPALIDAIIERQAREPARVAFSAPFPLTKQVELGRALAARIGFDFARGRMDVSVHPFCGGAAEDVRMTTRYDERDFLSGLMGTVHETGHSLYESGLPRAWVRQPVGMAVGMALHESQSLLIEMQACRSRAFLGHLATVAQETFVDHPRDELSAENLARHALHVERGLIRVDADEATYPLHVAVRFRLERALIHGDLALADLPGAFRETMQKVVGAAPSDDRDGCMQDVHWPAGMFGYFPSYTLGAMAAAQLFRHAVSLHPEILEELAQGEFGTLRGFLRAHVHAHGSRFDTNTLLTRVTGKALDASFLIEHLRARYLAA